MLWIKAFHIIFMVTWFAGIFYLPRLFVYHAMSEDKATQAQFKIMERKLYYFVTPFMILTTALGLWMLYGYAWMAYKSMGWLHIKLVLVSILIGYHFYCGKLVKEFAADRNQRSHVFYRWFNELPVLILFAVVLLAVIKPF
ncbi:MAG: protoporphyrinogen oxidase HemJ [Gammaproteobacteria bacterium]|nr:protoporphyrinogen oxidase HemJ [Gammaproteobacteria bacterium]